MSSPSSIQAPGEPPFSLPIAKLIPLNSNAEKALDELMEYPRLSDHHREFIEAERVVRGEELFPDRDTASKNIFEGGDRSSPMELWAGHYALNFSTAPTVGWRAGRGLSKLGEDRGVDLMICRPERGSKAGIAPLHALIQFHAQSGVLMLVGLSDSYPVEFLLDCKRAPLLLRHNQKHVLHQKVNRFALGKLVFKLVYEDFDDQGSLDRYTNVRNEWFENLGWRAPNRYLDAVPQKQYNVIGTIVLHRSMSSGTFGWVYAGVDFQNGNPVAVKELSIKDRRIAQHDDLKNELNVATSFQVCSQIRDISITFTRWLSFSCQ